MAIAIKYLARGLLSSHSRGNRPPAPSALIRAKAAEHSWRIVALEIMPDHVHLFVKAHPSDSPSRIANQFKGSTSRILRQEFPHLRSRLPTLWSRSYFVATVGAVSAATVKRYIDTQCERPWRKEIAVGEDANGQSRRP